MTDPWNPSNPSTPTPPTQSVPDQAREHTIGPASQPTQPVPVVSDPATERTVPPVPPPGSPPPGSPPPGAPAPYGTPGWSQAPAPGGPTLPPPPDPRYQNRRDGLTPLTIVLLVTGAVILGAAATLLVAKVVSGPEPTSPATTAESPDPTTGPSTSITTDTTPTTPTTNTLVTAPSLADVRTLPQGYFCRDLKAMGYDVDAAIEYFLYWGRPEQMDADHNGIPCETVYPDAAAAWSRGGN
ncbi:MAG: hypothetical protein JST64_03695 [Actinobacteria bacterium]|nr:hypothetical protein [Actinomycetota bacterium]